MGFGGSIEEGGLTGVDRLEKLRGVAFFLEVDQVLIVSEDSHVRERPPSSLYFLNSCYFLRFLRYFLLSLKVASPGPLYLNGGNMIHGKTVVLK